MFSIFGQTVKKDDGNDPWDGIRRNMGTGRVKSCVVTKLNYMKKSKQAYVFSLSKSNVKRINAMFQTGHRTIHISKKWYYVGMAYGVMEKDANLKSH